MPAIEVCNLTKQFGSVAAVDDFSAVFPGEQTSVIIGPSGAGKSTLLRIVAGLERPNSGTVKIGSLDVGRLAPHEREIALLTQDYTLYPQQTIEKNLQAALASAKLSRAERSERIAQTLEMLGIADLSLRRPNQLSGGQRQRAALGRAIVRRPQTLLLDEPLSQLDVGRKVELRQLLATLAEELRLTTLAVLHDPLDAMILGDKAFVVDQGRLLQSGGPGSIYGKPESTTAAELLSPLGINWLNVDQLPNECLTASPLLQESAAFAGLVRRIGFRPEVARLLNSPKESVDSVLLPVRVNATRSIGASQWTQCVWSAADGAEVGINVAGGNRRLESASGANHPEGQWWVVVDWTDVMLQGSSDVILTADE